MGKRPQRDAAARNPGGKKWSRFASYTYESPEQEQCSGAVAQCQGDENATIQAMDTYPLEDRLVYDPLADGISEVELIEYGGSPLSVVNAARISHAKRTDLINEWVDPKTGNVLTTKSEDLYALIESGTPFEHRQRLSKKDAKRTRYLLDHNHGSPFESSYWEVRVKMPIFVFRHLVRHRMLSPNEKSSRYVEMDEQFYVPVEWRVQGATNHQSSVVDPERPADWHREQTRLVMDLYREIYAAYQQLLRNGVAREMARNVLPLGLYTEVIIRGNLRSLMHLMELRDSEDAQYETRMVSRAIYRAVRPVFKETLEVWEDVREQKLRWAAFQKAVAQPENEGADWRELWERTV